MKYPIPGNETDFEIFCLKFLKALWQCPSLDLYAHRGEKRR